PRQDHRREVVDAVAPRGLEIGVIDARATFEYGARAADEVHDRNVRTLGAQLTHQIAIEGMRVADVDYHEVHAPRRRAVETAVVARSAERRTAELAEARADRLSHLMIGADDQRHWEITHRHLIRTNGVPTRSLAFRQGIRESRHFLSI